MAKPPWDAGRSKTRRCRDSPNSWAPDGPKPRMIFPKREWIFGWWRYLNHYIWLRLIWTTMRSWNIIIIVVHINLIIIKFIIFISVLWWYNIIISIFFFVLLSSFWTTVSDRSSQNYSDDSHQDLHHYCSYSYIHAYSQHLMPNMICIYMLYLRTIYVIYIYMLYIYILPKQNCLRVTLDPAPLQWCQVPTPMAKYPRSRSESYRPQCCAPKDSAFQHFSNMEVWTGLRSMIFYDILWYLWYGKIKNWYEMI